MAMTAFETATLAFQKATVAFQESTMRFQESTIGFQNASLELQRDGLYLQEAAIYVQAGVGLLQAALIGYGLWMMHRASTDRNRLMDEERVRADRRHEEAMTALKELIARTASPSSPPGASAA